MPDRENVIAWLTEISLRPCDFTRDDFDATETERLANDAIEIVEDAEIFCKQRNDAIAMLKEQEAVSAHWDDDTGHWIEGDRNGIDPHTRTTGEMIDTFRCSWCGFYQYWKTPFCPNCGAKMEGR